MKSINASLGSCFLFGFWDVSVFQDGDSRDLGRFDPHYLRAVHSIDLPTLSHGTMRWQNRVMLSFFPDEDQVFSGSADLEIYPDFKLWTWSIAKDLDQNTVFVNFLGTRQEVIVLLRGSLGNLVGQKLCNFFDLKCTFIHLGDLPTSYTHVKETLTQKYQQQMKTSRAVLLLPFDIYHQPAQGLLDHPHWEVLALMVAHYIAKNSLEDVVLHLTLSTKYDFIFHDVVVIFCPSSLHAQENSLNLTTTCSGNPVLVHAIQYLGNRFIEAGIASKLYYGFLWHDTVHLAWDVGDFGSKAFWGLFGAQMSGMKVDPMLHILHVNPAMAMDPSNLWSYVWEKGEPPNQLGANLLLSMPGSGQTYTRIMLELISQRPSRAVGYYFTYQGKSLAECFPELSVNITAEPILWVAHSAFEAKKCLGENICLEISQVQKSSKIQVLLMCKIRQNFSQYLLSFTLAKASKHVKYGF